MKRRFDPEGLTTELASLSRLELNVLRERWAALYCSSPPVHFRRSLLIRAIAYRLQENAFGGLKPETRRALQRIADNVAAGKAPSTAPSRKLKPGSRLLREWHGVTHEVIVLENGVLFRGQRYRSLSEVARVITRSRRSGPLFFGLKAASSERSCV